MGARLVGLSFLWQYLQLGVITVVVGLLCIGGGGLFAISMLRGGFCYWGLVLLKGWLLSFLGFVVDLPGVEGEKVCVCVCVCVCVLVAGFTWRIYL